MTGELSRPQNIACSFVCFTGDSSLGTLLQVNVTVQICSLLKQNSIRKNTHMQANDHPRYT